MAWNHRTLAQELQIIGLSREHTQRAIAKIVGVSPWTVQDVQHKYHLTLSFGQSVSSAQFRYRYDEHKWGRMIELLYVTNRLSLHETARRCGVDIGTVRRRMDHLGIPRRSSSESQRGSKRGRYNMDLPPCASGCGTGVRTPGEEYCANCRRSACRRRRAGSIAAEAIRAQG
jgi:hypothetical protein